MKASDIFFFAKEALGHGLKIQKDSQIHQLVKHRLRLSDPAKGGKTLNLLRDIDRVLSLGCISPGKLTHDDINDWLAKHEAKKAKRKAAKENPAQGYTNLEQYIRMQLNTMEQYGDFSIATDTVRAWIDIYEMGNGNNLGDWLRRKEIKQKRFQSGGFCPDSASQEGVLGKGEHVAISSGVEQVRAAVEKFAKQTSSQAPPCSSLVVSQDEQPQGAEPRPFQLGDKVKVKGREGVHQLVANPDYPSTSNYPLMTPLLDLSGDTVLQKFTNTGHWTKGAQENGLPPVLELVEPATPQEPKPQTPPLKEGEEVFVVNRSLKGFPTGIIDFDGREILVGDLVAQGEGEERMLFTVVFKDGEYLKKYSDRKWVKGLPLPKLTQAHKLQVVHGIKEQAQPLRPQEPTESFCPAWMVAFPTNGCPKE